MSPQAIMEMVWPALAAPIVMPLVQWVKKKIPKDLPLLSSFLAVILSGLFVWGIDWFFSLDLTRFELAGYTLGSNFASQKAHSIWKTLKKHTNLGG